MAGAAGAWGRSRLLAALLAVAGLAAVVHGIVALAAEKPLVGGPFRDLSSAFATLAMPVKIVSFLPDLPEDRVRSILAGLPPSDGYPVLVKALRWRRRPHLSAYTSFD